MISNRPLFGPGGNSEDFNALYKGKTLYAPAFVKSIGLDAYEYEAGQGIHASEEMLRAIGREAVAHGVHMSFHTPYFISLSSTEEQKRINSVRYIADSLYAAHCLGASTIVVHTGSAGKISRSDAMALAADTLAMALEQLDFYGVSLGLETMGKQNQLGTLEEVLTLCAMDRRLVPVVDFGHLNARDCGGVFPDADSYRRVFDRIAEAKGDEVARHLHCHFSRIEYTDKGEKRHHTFAQTQWGPEYEPLMEAIAKEGLCPTVISESAGTQSADALTMKKHYLSLL